MCYNSERVEYQAIIHIQFLRNCEVGFTSSVDFIYGYSDLILSEFWIGYFFVLGHKTNCTNGTGFRCTSKNLA